MSRHTRRRSVLRRALLTMLATTAVAGAAAPVAAAAEPASTNGAHGFAGAEAAQAPTLTNDVGSLGGGPEPELAAGLVLLAGGLAGVIAGVAAARPRTRSQAAQVATTQPV